MKNSVVADSGPLLALFNGADEHHAEIRGFLGRHPAARLITTWAVLGETAALLFSHVDKQAELDFLTWVERGGLSIVDLAPGALGRMLDRMRKYRDPPFDFANAAVAELAAQAGTDRILTVDSDFDVYALRRGVRLENVLKPRAR